MFGKMLNKISVVLLLLVVGTAIVGVAHATQPNDQSLAALAASVAKEKAAMSDTTNTSQQYTVQPNLNVYAQGVASCPENVYNSEPSTTNITQSWGSLGDSTQALMTSAATKGNVENYWKNDPDLVYYNNIGEAAYGVDQHGNYVACYNLSFYDGNIEASTIHNLNPATGLQYSLDFINSCCSFLNPIYSAFLAHNPEMY